MVNFRQLAQDWFAAWQAAHPTSYRTAQSYEGLLQNILLPRLGKYELKELTPLRLKRYFTGLAGGRYPICGAGTAKNAYKLLRTILGYAATEGLVEDNPCTPAVLRKEILVKLNPGPHRELPVFSPMEQEKLMAVCERNLWGNLILFDFHTGLPLGELLAIRQEDVDQEAGGLFVSNRLGRIRNDGVKDAKTRLALLPVDPYTIPLSAGCRKIIEAQLHALRRLQAIDDRRNPEHLIFATPDGCPVEANVLRHQLEILEHRAGVRKLPFAAIRDTVIRQALEAGATDIEVMHRFHIKDRQAFVRRYRRQL